MRRVAAASLLLFAAAARADRMPDYQPEVRAAIAEVCVVGTVTEIEKEPVLAKAYPGATDATAYTVAVVKVETNVQGAKGVTHVRVGFIPTDGRPVRYPQPSLKADQKVCLFLNKLPDAPIHLMPPLSPPLEANDANKDVVARIAKLAPVFADPLAALKAEMAADRAASAGVLLTKYRHGRLGGGNTEPKAIPADESKAILAALAGADWKATGPFAPSAALNLLALTKADGFAFPQPKPGEDLAELLRGEFKRWYEADGAKYEVKRFVPKAK